MVQPDARVQWCEVGVGVVWSRGNEPGVGVGAYKTVSNPTPERFV